MAKARKTHRPPVDHIHIGFDMDPVVLDIATIIPLKLSPKNMLKNRRYRQLVASIKAVGIIEPIVVVADKQANGRYMLLDGHLRLEALKEIGETQVTCLVSTDDEAFTYNRHINHLSAIQEHKMILNAIDRGVAVDKIAQALNMDPANIIRKKSLLDGICLETIELLKDKIVPETVFYVLKHMGPLRQIEAASLMNEVNIYSVPYARALLAATPKDQLKDPQKPKNIKGLTDEQMRHMESEMSIVQKEHKQIEENYNTDVMNLVLAKGYLTHLLGNARIVRYLAQQHPEFLSNFQRITEMTSLGDKTAD